MAFFIDKRKVFGYNATTKRKIKVTTMIKQDIIKAREELAIKEARFKGAVFERTYKTIREALDLMINYRQEELMKNSFNVKMSEHTVRRLESLGITVCDYPFKILFRLERL